MLRKKFVNFSFYFGSLLQSFLIVLAFCFFFFCHPIGSTTFSSGFVWNLNLAINRMENALSSCLNMLQLENHEFSFWINYWRFMLMCIPHRYVRIIKTSYSCVLFKTAYFPFANSDLFMWWMNLWRFLYLNSTLHVVQILIPLYLCKYYAIFKITVDYLWWIPAIKSVEVNQGGSKYQFNIPY